MTLTSQPDGATTFAEPAHGPFQSASERYFSDLNMVWYGAQRRLQDLQFEFMRAQTQLAQHGQTQQKDFATVQNEFQSLQEKFQKDFQTVANDPASAKGVVEAYEKYVAAVRQGFAELDPKRLDPVTLCLVAQTLFAVSHLAEQVNNSCRLVGPAADAV
jgi:hypothetical protein